MHKLQTLLMEERVGYSAASRHHRPLDTAQIFSRVAHKRKLSNESHFSGDIAVHSPEHCSKTATNRGIPKRSIASETDRDLNKPFCEHKARLSERSIICTILFAYSRSSSPSWGRARQNTAGHTRQIVQQPRLYYSAQITRRQDAATHNAIKLWSRG